MANKFVSALAVGVCTVALAAPAQAQERNWSIAAGDLKQALDNYARRSGRQIIYKVDEVRGVHSPGVAGNYSPEAALAAILSGTGFAAQGGGSSSVAIVRVAPRPTSQESAPPPGQSVRPASDTIVVTGTNIHGQEEPVGSQLIVIDRREIERSGHSTAMEIVRALPQNFGGGVSNDTGFLNAGAGLADSASTTNANAGTSFNLRGVGGGATLTLINGRRPAPSGGAAAYTDVSTIPITAIERVEVLPDGASALYGSDAIGGVVNFVLRKDFNGAESRASFGTVTDGGLTEVVLGQTLGKRWSTGGVLLTGEYYREEPLKAIDRPAFNLDFRRYGGVDRRTMECTPGTLTVSGQSFALNGTTTPTAGSNLCSPDDLQLYPRIRRTSVLGFADQEIGSIFKIDVDGNWVRTINARNSLPFGTSVTIPSTNPYYINPLGNGAPVTVTYDQDHITGPVLAHIATDTYGGGFTLTARPGKNWTIAASVAYGAERVDQHTGYVDPISLSAAAAGTTTATAFNPFLTPAGNSSAVLAYLTNSLVNLYTLKTQQWIYRLSADGPLFALPGGEVRIAAGIERRDLSLVGNGVQQFVNFPANTSTFGSNYSRGVDAAFGEVVVPVFGDSNSIPGFRKLELSAALRGERYSDFGDVLVPKFGVNWSPFDGFKTRASFSRSFRAPSPNDLAGQQNSFLYPLPDSHSPTGSSIVLILNGGNKNLTEEKARTYSLGFDWAPPSVPGLRFSVSYYDIDYSGRILVPTFTFNTLNDPTFVGVIDRNVTPAKQAALCASTVFGGNATGRPGTCATIPANVIVDARSQNVAKLLTNGIDIMASYSFPLGGGHADVSTNAAYVFRYAYGTSGSSLANFVNTVGNVPQLKIRSSVGWSIGGFSSAVYMDFVGASHDVQVTPARPVSAYASFDLNLSYTLGGDHGLLGHTKLNLNVQNLFDRQPPFVDNVQFGYDVQNYDLRGRFIRLSLTKGW